MVNFKEMFTPERFITKLGAISFPTNIFKDEKRTPHYEMSKCLDLYETRPLINSGIKQLVRFITGNEVTAKSADPKSHEFMNNWITQRTGFDNEVTNMAISGLVTGNLFAERTWKKMTNGGFVLDNMFNINDTSRCFINLDINDNEEDKYWLYEIPIEVKYLKAFGDNASPAFWKINYVRGSYLFAKMLWAIPVHKSKIVHKSFGFSRDGIYGRSFLASAIDDGEVLTEILKNYSVIARYRAIGRKIFSIGSPEDPAGPDDIDKLECDLKNIQDQDHIIINKPINSQALSFTGENDPMDSQLDFLRRDIGSGLVPNFLTPWNSEVNRATAGEVKIPFQLEINSFESDLIEFLNTAIIDELRKVYTWLAKDTTFSFGKIDLESKDEKMTYARDLYQANIITMNEYRQAAGFEAVNGGDQFLITLEPGAEDRKVMFGNKVETNTLKEAAVVDEDIMDNDLFLKKLKKREFIDKVENWKVKNRFSVRGAVLRQIADENEIRIYDGLSVQKSFLKDEKEVADLYFKTLKERRVRELDEFVEGDEPEDKIMEDFYEEVKRLNAEVIEQVFKELPKSKVKLEKFLKEAQGVDESMLGKLGGIFSTFNDRIGEIVSRVTQKLFGIAVDPTVSIGGTEVQADKATQDKLAQTANILNQRATNQLKTMNDKMRQDVFNTLSDGIATGQKLSDIKQELKDKYSQFKSKDNPQDWQIARVVRTELSNSTNILRLQKWKDMGFESVRHLTVLDKVTGEKDRSFNRKVFKIQYLLDNEPDRIPLHPNCRCKYIVYD